MILKIDDDWSEIVQWITEKPSNTAVFKVQCSVECLVFEISCQPGRTN